MPSDGESGGTSSRYTLWAPLQNQASSMHRFASSARTASASGRMNSGRTQSPSSRNRCRATRAKLAPSSESRSSIGKRSRFTRSTTLGVTLWSTCVPPVSKRGRRCPRTLSRASRPRAARLSTDIRAFAFLSEVPVAAPTPGADFGSRRAPQARTRRIPAARAPLRSGGTRSCAPEPRSSRGPDSRLRSAARGRRRGTPAATPKR